MIDYKTFKKGFLNEWVGQSQVARKAAEELANKDGERSLRDTYKPQNVVMTLNGRQVEFKGENEKNPNDPKYNLFTYEEAMERFGKPDKDGWRLPTKEEFVALGRIPYVFDEERGIGIFGSILGLPAAGLRYCFSHESFIGNSGCYWSATHFKSSEGDFAYRFKFSPRVLDIDYYAQCYGYSVRLLRDL